MEAAEEMTAEMAAAHVIIVIGTDSKSLCLALVLANRDTDKIRHLLGETDARIIIQWLPGHCNNPGNEVADRAAKYATLLPDPHKPISMKCASSVIKKHIRDGELERPWLSKVYSCYSNQRDKLIHNRHSPRFAHLPCSAA